MSTVPEKPLPFALAFRPFPDGQRVIGTYGTSFSVFHSTKELTEYLRATADRVERQWADYIIKERATITPEKPTP